MTNIGSDGSIDILLAGNVLARSAPSRKGPGELTLIKAISRLAGPASRALRVGIGDDCAVLRPKAGHEICVTTDFSLEGRHFRREWHSPESVGHRCLARGLSDLAAMGAEPLGVFLSLAVPRSLAGHWVERFLAGFLALAEKHRVPLAGGDTAESPAASQAQEGLVVADIVGLGQVPRGGAVLRSGARAGDSVYVTGALGGAAAELRVLSENPRKFRKLTAGGVGHPHLFPEPRVEVGRRVRKFAHAMIDISDGLSTDLTHLCRCSGVAAVIDEDALPIHPLAAESGSRLDLALHGGEDYELLFTASAEVRVPGKVAGVPIHRIGAMRAARGRMPGIVLNCSDGRHISVEPDGWEHFR